MDFRLRILHFLIPWSLVLPSAACTLPGVLVLELWQTIVALVAMLGEGTQWPEWLLAAATRLGSPRQRRREPNFICSQSELHQT